MIAIAVLLGVAAIALLTVAALGWKERLPRNPWIGIRTKTTMSSDEVWYASHRCAAPWFTASGVLMAIGAALSSFADSEPLMGIIGGILVVFAVFGVAAGLMTATDAARKRLAQQIGEGGPPDESARR